MQQVKQLYFRLINVGIDENDDVLVKNNTKSSNIFIILIFIACLISFFISYTSGITPLTHVTFFMGVSSLVIAYLKHLRLFLLAYYVFVVAGSITVCYTSYFVEYIGTNYFTFSALAVASIVHFKNRTHVYIFFIVGFTTFILSLWLQETSTVQVQLQETTRVILLLFNIFCSFSLLFFSGHLYAKSVQEHNFIINNANKKAEKQLYENQLLLKEVNHRVKNNFQIVSSLVQIQSREIEDERAKSIITEGQKRLKAMALIHQELYQSDDLRINIQDFIKSLIENIYTAYGSQQITYNLEVSPNTTFDVDTSIPLGLIINELIANSFKYAIAPSENATINIRLILGAGECILSVSDNGPGIESRTDFLNNRSVGLKLVKRLVKQLEGTISYETNGGASFDITFKNSEMRWNID